MSSGVLAIGAPSVPRSGILSRIGSALSSAIGNLADALSTAEEAVFDRYDTAVENRLGANTPKAELGMSFPRMLWRTAAFIGGAAALGLLA